MTLIREAPVAIPIETLTPIRLSEAIRLGSLGSVQAFECYEDKIIIDGKPHTARCALGAGAAAMHEDGTGFSDHLDEQGRIVTGIQRPTCPELEELESCRAHGWASTIIHLNDDHRWTREAIADWLEGQGL